MVMILIMMLVLRAVLISNDINSDDSADDINVNLFVVHLSRQVVSLPSWLAGAKSRWKLEIDSTT